jgi:hypothetical protein
MKQIIALTLLSTLITGCDAPQRTRLVEDALSSKSSTDAFGSPVNTTTGGATSGTTTGSGTSTTTLPTGFASCNLATTYYAPGIGNTSVCQSSADETSILIRPSLTDTSARTCLIPTYKDASGSSAYIGQPQCLYTQEGAMVVGKLYKNRNGFTGYPLNGVMIMKEGSLASYFQCMDAYVSYVSQACPYGAKTNATCDQYARNYMTQLCNTFKTNTSYIDVKLK